MTFSDQRGPGACARPAPVGVRQAANHLLEQKVLNIIQVGRQSDPKSSDFQTGKCLLSKKRFCGREVWNVSPKSTAPYKVVTFLNCPKSPLLYHGPISWTWLMRVRKIYIPMPERKHSININFSLLIADIFCHQPYHDQGFPKSKKMNKASNGRLCSCVMSWCQKF